MKDKTSEIRQSDWQKYRNSVELTEQEKELIEIEKKIMKTVVEARKEAKLTQNEVSKKTNIKVTSISRFENGNTDPKLSTLVKYLNSLGKTISIVDEEDNVVLTK